MDPDPAFKVNADPDSSTGKLFTLLLVLDPDQGVSSSVVDSKLFFSDPDSDPIFVRIRILFD
jgi:hypothetical protein